MKNTPIDYTKAIQEYDGRLQEHLQPFDHAIPNTKDGPVDYLAVSKAWEKDLEKRKFAVRDPEEE